MTLENVKKRLEIFKDRPDKVEEVKRLERKILWYESMEPKSVTGTPDKPKSKSKSK